MLLFPGLVVALASSRIALEGDVAPLETRHGWTKGARASGESTLELTFLLHQQNVDKLEKKLGASSDPSSPSYGQHMTNDAIHKLLTPSVTARRAVVGFLESHGVSSHRNATPNGDMISATVPIAKAEEMLACQYHSFVHADGAMVSRTLAYSLPAAVAPHVAAVTPTVQLPSRRQPFKVSAPPPDGLFNTPNSLRKLYSVNEVQGQSPANKMAVTAFLGQRFSVADLTEFYKLLMNSSAFHDATSRTIALKGDDGGKSVIGGTESMLDIEYSTALGANISAEFWGYKGRAPREPENEPFLKWLTQLASTPDADVPKVFSTSYGEDETSTSMAYAKRLNAEFIKAGARGISLLFASGDSGASGDHGCAGPKNDQFVAQWPAGSPYVTGVGGTMGSKEKAVPLSSGGFSYRWPRPSWQSSAVATYIQSGKLPATGPNATALKGGRGFPDLSAQAVNYLVVSMRIPEPVAGTSCASPTAAGVIALLNDRRLQQGKSSLGFLNPLLYKHADALNDITSGVNEGCSSFGGGGYPAAVGWDPVTGLGTPNYEKMAQALDALP